MSERVVLQNLIGGRWQPAEPTELLDVANPATGERLALVPMSGALDVDRAVSEARRSVPGWRDTPLGERVSLLLRLRGRILEKTDDLVRTIALENGKSVAEAKGSLQRGVEAIEFAASAPTVLQGAVVEDVARGVDSELFRQPVGVVAGITPFNFPLMIPLWMAPIALVCGNAFILKPSERVPLTATRLAELVGEAGFPAGVFSLVHGGRTAVDALLTHPGVDAISFVGSAPTAEHVYRTASAAGKRVQALAGAKNHLIVLPDADLDLAVDAIVSSAFGQAGERCLAGSVVLAVGDGADPLVARLAERVRSMRPGGPDGPSSLGPLIRPELRVRVEGYVRAGVEEGAVLVARGADPPTEGYYSAPALFDHVRPDMSIAQEEIFGPVLSVIRVPDLSEALRVANASRYGNAAAIFTKDGRAAREFRYRMEAGMLGVNIGVPAPPAFFPFVGWKGSFFGDLHATGRDAFDFYTRKKVVTSRWR